MSLPAQLLEDAKNYLDMTWADDAGEQKLSGILARGMAYLNRIAGENLNYGTEGQPRKLLCDYARYDLSGATQDFASDFLLELNTLNAECEVMRHAEENPDFQ